MSEKRWSQVVHVRYLAESVGIQISEHISFPLSPVMGFHVETQRYEQ